MARLIYTLIICTVLSMLSPIANAKLICTGEPTISPKVAGLYVDNFAGWHSVGKEAWLMLSGINQLVFHVCSVDNAKNFLIAQNSEANDFNPAKYSRFEWFGKDGQLFYCQQVFDATSSADAENFVKYPAANTSDANDKGCGKSGKFAWSQMSLIRR